MDALQLRKVFGAPGIRALIAAAVFVGLSANAFADDKASGEQTVTRQCSLCHGSGLMGAPRIGDKTAWSARLQSAGSIDKLLESARRGKRSMPPSGGLPTLTDEELRSAIQYMTAKSGV